MSALRAGCQKSRAPLAYVSGCAGAGRRARRTSSILIVHVFARSTSTREAPPGRWASIRAWSGLSCCSPVAEVRIAATVSDKGVAVRAGRSESMATGLAVSLILAVGGLSACGGDDGGGSGDKVPYSSLKARLIPAGSVPGFTQQRTFDWSDPVNLVGEGMRLPEATRPSAAVKVFTDAGLRGGAGEFLTKGDPPNDELLATGVAVLKSPDGAKRARDWMHGQDLQQPCYTKCIYRPRS